MQIGNIISSLKTKDQATLGAIRFHEERNPSLEVCSTFQELADVFPSVEMFVNETRMTVSLKLLFDGVEIGLLRDNTIYLGNEDDIEINLDIIDALIAARKYLPGDEYGLLGKIDELRNNTSKYYDKKIKVEMDYWSYAYEKNLETGEECYMSKGTLEFFDEELLKVILNDPKVKLLSPKI